MEMEAQVDAEEEVVAAIAGLPTHITQEQEAMAVLTQKLNHITITIQVVQTVSLELVVFQELLCFTAVKMVKTEAINILLKALWDQSFTPINTTSKSTHTSSIILLMTRL